MDQNIGCSEIMGPLAFRCHNKIGKLVQDQFLLIVTNPQYDRYTEEMMLFCVLQGVF